MEYAGTVMRTGARTRFAPADAFVAAGLVYVMALVTALYPAWKVAKLPPAGRCTRARPELAVPLAHGSRLRLT